MLQEQKPLKQPGIRVALAMVVASAAFWLCSPAMAASGMLTFVFYNSSGILLSASQVHAIARGPGTGKNAGYDADAFLDPTTMEMVGSPNPMDTGLTVLLPLSPASVDFAMNWPAGTANGYSLVVLDNNGAGFTTSGTVNFTYRAANDAKTRLDAALAERNNPVYVHSPAFGTAYTAATSYLASANASGASESTKGKYGALALDQIDVATDLMLKEYGTTYAKMNTAVADRWAGFTMDESQSGGTKYESPVDTVQSMTSSVPATESGWIRFVMDPTQPVSSYVNEITYAHAKGLKVMVEPVDSAYCDAHSHTPGFACSLSSYHTAFANATTQLTGAAAPDAFEVGNEINGDWVLSSGSNTPAARLADAASVVSANAPNKLRVVTLFYQVNTAASATTSLFNWVDSNLSTPIRANLDVILLSTYVEQAPLGLAFNQVMRQMQQDFPGKKIGIGELGYWIAGQRYWWAFSNIPSTQKATAAQLEPIADQYYRSSLGYAGSIGGGFWWNYPSEVATQAPFRAVFSQIRDDLGSGGSGGGSGNAHGGTWAGRGTIPATAAFEDLYQDLTVTPGSTDTASIWIRGSGAVKFTLWGNAAWTVSLASKKCNATSTWTQCSLPTFATGSHTTVHLDLEDAYSGAGTLYVDDAFVGQSGGSNLVTNPGFEFGAAGWTSTNANIWTVLQP